MKEIRSTGAALASLCGVTIGIGGLLIWMRTTNAGPTIGMDHTSFPKMLVYTFVHTPTYWKSSGFVMLVLGVVMALGGLAGLRILTAVGAVLALALAGLWIGLTAHHFVMPHAPNSYYLNPIRFPWSKLRPGAWLTLGAALLGLVSTLVPRSWQPLIYSSVGQPGASRRLTPTA